MIEDPSYLIVNADDYGYFRCVNRGILEAHKRGIVTATGILANGPEFERDIELLRAEERLDLGVHLNVTTGPALSAGMRSRLRKNDGRFSGKAAFACAYMAGRIRVADVEEEWRAQIARCLAQDLRLLFLNSHEHLHAFPSLFDLAHRLAADYGMPYVRCPRADGLNFLSPAVLLRDTAIMVLAMRNIRRASGVTPYFLGMRASGKLTEAEIVAILQNVVPGRAYELMCHPGRLDPSEVSSTDLLEYHDWEGELKALCSPTLRSFLERRNIRVIGFRDLVKLSGKVELSGNDPNLDRPLL